MSLFFLLLIGSYVFSEMEGIIDRLKFRLCNEMNLAIKQN